MSKKLSLFLVIAIVLSSLLPAASAYGLDNGFTDMPDENHWSYNALKSAVDNGLLKGYNNKLNPDSCVTRAQIAAVINRAFGAVDTAEGCGC